MMRLKYSSRDGASLMGEAFKDADPPIALADLSTETGTNSMLRRRFDCATTRA
jgi:hypothetical protein